jgi:hypothetical protein
MAEFGETHLKCLLALAGTPVVSVVGEHDGRGPVLAAIYLPPDSTIKYDDGRTRTYSDGVFVSSHTGMPSHLHPDVAGFTSLSVDDTYFEKEFQPCTANGRTIPAPIDKAAWTIKTIAAVNQLRNAGFSTMPAVNAPVQPDGDSARNSRDRVTLLSRLQRTHQPAG